MTCAVLGFEVDLGAAREPHGPILPNLDRRPSSPRAASPAQEAARRRLEQRLPAIEVCRDPLTGSPAWVCSPTGFLSGPGGEGGGGPDGMNDPFAGSEHGETLAFVEAHQELFGHGAAVLMSSPVRRDWTHNGFRSVVWEQQWEGIPVFQALFSSHCTGRGELAAVSSCFLPDVRNACHHDLARARDGTGIQETNAIAIAAGAIDAVAGVMTPSGRTAEGAGALRGYRVEGLKGETLVRRVWVPMNAGRAELGWEVFVTGEAEMYRVVVDAETGEVLVRHCLTEYASPVSMRVFTGDSPTPMSPGHGIPLTNQPPLVSRVWVVTNGFSAGASPLGWLAEGGNETVGNNVAAHLDRNNDNVADLPRPQGSPDRVFEPALDLGQAPAVYGDAAVVQLFYWNNWIHDRLYGLGFTEASGNFQTTNFNRGGLGGDAVEADAQNGGGTDNANFTAPPDGIPGRMQTFLWTAPNPDRDGSFDAEVVLHEYVHGLSARLVGGGAGISALQSRGLGEGWSDFYALALLSEAGDDPAGNHAFGAYLAQRASGTENYYFGLRRYPYTTNSSVNPLTFRDIDPGLAGSHGGVPRNRFAPAPAAQVHNMGEVWCVTLWGARAGMIAQHGFAAGNEMILQLVTDGMRLAPPNPTFLQARDAILMADLINNNGAHRDLLWAAFAARGMGFSATGPDNSTTSGVLEAFDVFDELMVSPRDGLSSAGPVGGRFLPNAIDYTLTNAGTNDVNWSAVPGAGWVSVSPNAGLLGAGDSVSVTVSVNGLARLFPEGQYLSAVGFTNLNSGRGRERAVSLTVGPAAPPGPLQLSLPAGAMEGDGILFGAGTITLDQSLAADLLVQLASDDPTEVRVPPGVIVPAGSVTAAFDVTILDDPLFDGSRRAVVTASAPGYAEASVSMEVTDNESTGLMVFVPAFLTEGDSETVGRVLAERAADEAVLVRLSADDPTQLLIPPFTIIPPGGSVALFPVGVVDDGEIDGDRVVIVSAEVDNWRGDIDAVLVADNETTQLALTLPRTEVVEGAGLIAIGGVVRLSGTLRSNLVVSILSDDVSEIEVPASLTILAGSTLGLFSMTVLDDSVADGDQRVTIAVSAPGFGGVAGVIDVVDNETPPAPQNLSPPNGASNVAASVTLSWRLNEPGPPLATIFDVYLGTHPGLGPADRVGTTSNTTFEVGVVPLETYYWQVVARRVGTRAGPVWSFTTRGVDRLEWQPVATPQRMGEPFNAVLTALDENGVTVSNFTGTVAIGAVSGGDPGGGLLLISAVETGDPDRVVFVNAGLAEVDISGWEVSVYDRQSWPGERLRFELPPGTIHQPGEIWTLGEVGAFPGFYPFFSTGTNINWVQETTNNPVAVLLRNRDGAIVDFFCGGDASPEVIREPVPVPVSEWLGDPVPVNTNATLRYERVGSLDRGDAGDWVLAEAGSGVNEGLLLPFLGDRMLAVLPTVTGPFVNGSWQGSIVVLEPAEAVRLTAGWAGQPGLSNPFLVEAFEDLSVEASVTPGRVAVGARFTLLLRVNNSGPSIASGVTLTNPVPEGVRFETVDSGAASCRIEEGLLICDLGLLEAGQEVLISIVGSADAAGSVTNRTGVTGTGPDGFAGNNEVELRWEVRVPAITLGDAVAGEGDGGPRMLVFPAWLSLPSAHPVTARFETRDGTAQAWRDYLAGMGTVLFAPGETNTSVVVQVIGDRLFESNETVIVTLSDAAGGSLVRTVATGMILDDEAYPAWTVGDVSVGEGDTGVRQMTFRVELNPLSSEPVEADFASVDGSAAGGSDYESVQGRLRFEPGVASSNVLVRIRGDTTVEEDEEFLLELSNPVNSRIADGAGSGRILNDDGLPGRLDRFEWELASGPVGVNRAFAARVTARDAMGGVVTNFSGPLVLRGLKDDTGPVEVLSFVRWADLSQGGEYERTLGAISNHFPNIATTATIETNAALLELELEGRDVFLIVEQETAGGGRMGVLGRSWAGLLNRFVARGGVVIVCSFEWDEHLVLAEGGFLGVTKGPSRTAAQITGDPSHPWNEGVSFPFPAGSMASYTVTNGMVILDDQGAAVGVANDAGLGHVLLLGTDFFENGTGLDRVIANAVRSPQAGRTREVPVRTAATGGFKGGVWSGEVIVEEPEREMFLVATNLAGRFGISDRFQAGLIDDLGLVATADAAVVSLGGVQRYQLVVTNAGPAAATGVWLTNILPATAQLLSVQASQGACLNQDGVLICNLGMVGPDAAARVEIEVEARSLGFMTNQVGIHRAEADPYLPNNHAQLVTEVKRVEIFAPDITVTEGDEGVTLAAMPVHLTLASSMTVSVSYATCSITASSASDYVRRDGVLIFSPGEVLQFVEVPVRNDRIYEPSPETFCLILFSPTNAILLDPEGIGTILDNEPFPQVSVSSTVALEGNIGGSVARFPVRLEPASAEVVSVEYRTEPVGEAVPGADFLALSDELNFPPGTRLAYVEVPLVGDLEVELDEDFLLLLVDSSRARLGNARGRGTILNDDGPPGVLDHFSWDAIASPQRSGEPFSASLQARDIYGALVPGYEGTVMLSVVTGTRTKVVFRDGFEDGALTGGDPASPQWMAGTGNYQRLVTNGIAAAGEYGLTLIGGDGTTGGGLEVAVGEVPDRIRFSVRAGAAHVNGGYFVAVDGEAVVVVEFYMGADGRMGLSADGNRWSVPYEAGRWYEIGMFIDWAVKRCDFLVDGQLVEAGVPIGGGDEIASIQLHNRQPGQFWWDEIEMERELPVSTPLIPSSSGPFATGEWAGDVVSVIPGTNVFLRADDGFGHAGLSEPFRIEGEEARLAVEREGQGIVLSWPGELGGFQLEQSPGLGEAAVWSPVALLPVLEGGSFRVTNDTSVGTIFYRLRR